jgi:serine/threonine protein kinase
VLGNPGGFGVAYKALDTKHGAIVVIKECLLTESNQVSREPNEVWVHVNPGFRERYKKWLQRFRDEATHISRFSSPYIVRVTELFDENNTAYYVMPFVEGDDLSTHCATQGGRLPQDEVMELAQHLLSALAEMHKRGVVHRDIKPSNIIITRNKRRPALIDFGAARDHFDADHSKSHMAVHSPKFAPLEQMLGMSNQGAWTDIYSLCATLYFCLLGEPPPKASDRYDRDGKRPDPFVPIHERIPEINGGLAMVINNGLAVLPKTRIRDAATAIRLLDEATRPIDQAKSGHMSTKAPNESEPVQQTVFSPPAVMTSLRVTPQPQPSSVSCVGLLPAVAVVAYGVVTQATFSNYITEWAGLAVLVNVVGWLIWRANRKADPAAEAPPHPVASEPLEPNSPEVPEQAHGIEIQLFNEGFAPVREVIRPGSQVVVGRNPTLSSISIQNKMLSGEHVEIRVLEDGSFALQDMDSTNSTYVHDRHAEGSPAAWRRITSASGRKGRFMLGPPGAGGVLLELRPASIET